MFHKKKDQIEDQIKAIKNDNEIVLQNCYSTVYPKVEQYIVSNNGSVDEAKDIFQEAFLAMWVNVKNDTYVKSRGTIEVYLYQIAKYRWIDQLRSLSYKNKVSYTTFREGYDVNDIEKTQIESHSKLYMVMQNLNLLSKECETLLELFYFENRSIEEIAQKLNLKPASTKNKKYRCMQKLRSLVIQKQL